MLEWGPDFFDAWSGFPRFGDAFPVARSLQKKASRQMDSSEASKIIVAETACTLNTAAKLVKSEPLNASRVVALAVSIVCNSSGRKMVYLRTAVMRLGFIPVMELDSHFGRHANCPRQNGMFRNERRILLQKIRDRSPRQT